MAKVKGVSARDTVWDLGGRVGKGLCGGERV